MSRVIHRAWPLLLAALLIPASGGADRVGHVAVATRLDQPRLSLPISGDARLSRTATLDLTAGVNHLSFAFGRLGVPLDALDIEIVSPEDGVRITNTLIAPDARDTLCWEIVAERPCRATVIITHPLKGIERQTEYTATIDRASETLDISAAIILTNKSKLEFASARLEIVGGHELTTDLKLNETFRVPLFTARALPYRALFIHDTGRYGAGVAAVLRVLRDGDGPFSRRAAPGGKIRIYASGPTRVYVGEDTLPYLPPRESIDIKLGTVPEITVARKLVKSTQVDLKSDIRNKLVLFNLHDQVDLELKNAGRSPVVLRVRDKIDGDWSMLKHSAPFEKIDAQWIEFVVSLDPGQTQKLSYTARRHNRQP